MVAGDAHDGEHRPAGDETLGLERADDGSRDRVRQGPRVGLTELSHLVVGNLGKADGHLAHSVPVRHDLHVSSLSDGVRDGDRELAGATEIRLVDNRLDENVANLALAAAHVVDTDDVVPESRRDRTHGLPRAGGPRGIGEGRHQRRALDPTEVSPLVAIRHVHGVLAGGYLKVLAVAQLFQHLVGEGERAVPGRLAGLRLDHDLLEGNRGGPYLADQVLVEVLLNLLVRDDDGREILAVRAHVFVDHHLRAYLSAQPLAVLHEGPSGLGHRVLEFGR